MGCCPCTIMSVAQACKDLYTKTKRLMWLSAAPNPLKATCDTSDTPRLFDSALRREMNHCHGNDHRYNTCVFSSNKKYTRSCSFCTHADHIPCTPTTCNPHCHIHYTAHLWIWNVKTSPRQVAVAGWRRAFWILEQLAL